MWYVKRTYSIKKCLLTIIPIAKSYLNLATGFNLGSVKIIDPELFINIKKHQIYITYYQLSFIYKMKVPT